MVPWLDAFTGKGVLPFYPAIIFFLEWGALATFIPFFPLILAAKGLSTLELGIIFSILPLFQFISNPTVTFICDLSKKHKLIWCSLAVAAAIPGLLLQRADTFTTVLISMSGLSLLAGPLSALSDFSCVFYLGPEKKRYYGIYRCCGAISYAIISFIMGIIFNSHGYSLSFYCYVIGNGLLFVYVYLSSLDFLKVRTKTDEVVYEEEPKNVEIQLEVVHNVIDSSTKESTLNSAEEILTNDEIPAPQKEKEKQDELKKSLQQNSESIYVSYEAPSLLKIFLRLEVIVSYILVFLMGMGYRVLFVYQFIYLKTLGATDLLIGAATFLTIITELPFLLGSGFLIKWFGLYWMIVLAIFTMGVRLIALYFIDNPYFILPFQFLQSTSYGGMWVASVQYSSTIFPQQYSTLAQGMLQGIFNGISATCGSLVGGYIYKYYGGKIVFLSLGSLVFFGLFLYVITQLKQLRVDGWRFLSCVNDKIRSARAQKKEVVIEEKLDDGNVIEENNVKIDEKQEKTVVPAN